MEDIDRIGRGHSRFQKDGSRKRVSSGYVTTQTCGPGYWTQIVHCLGIMLLVLALVINFTSYQKLTWLIGSAGILLNVVAIIGLFFTRRQSHSIGI